MVPLLDCRKLGPCFSAPFYAIVGDVLGYLKLLFEKVWED